MTADLELGARVVEGGTRFRVWAPRARDLAVMIRDAVTPMTRQAGDMFEVIMPGIGAGTDYQLLIDGTPVRPDPVSRSQPHGVHGPSRIVDPAAFAWHDEAWRGHALEDYIIYELHVGTFTREGTFDAIIPKLPHLVSLGITAVELMPVTEFPGARNWGYDGVHMFAPHSAYGGPDGLRALVDACHAAGLSVILDVVYNHVGPEGNYLAAFAPYFTDRYTTPWGSAINVDGPHSDGVRRHLVTNALSWVAEYHVDALRLDAIHGIFDFSPRHVLAELHATIRAWSAQRSAPVYVIAESDLNDVRVVGAPGVGGYGLDAQWSDDFHHALRTVLTTDRRGYFADFGQIRQLVKAITEGFVYDGEFSPHRQRAHGTSAAELPGQRLVIYVQNHDQVANGSQGQRISTVIGDRAHALAATLLLTAPNVPLLFMGEEFAERAPFHYFVSHGDEVLIAAVREGRRRELAELADHRDLGDPQAEVTFTACKLDWSLLEEPVHAQMFALYRDLIALRRREPSLRNCRRDLLRASSSEQQRWLVIERDDPSGGRALIVANLGDETNQVPCAAATGSYRLALTTEAPRYGGAGGPAETLELAGDPVALTLPPHAARIYLGAAR